MSRSIKLTDVGVRRFRRLLTRALIVAGGSIATTATAWVLTTGVASAEELNVPSPLSPVSTAVQEANPTPIGRAATTVEDKLSEVPTLPTQTGSGVGKVAGKVHGTVTGVKDAVKPRLDELAEAASISVVNTSPEAPISSAISLDEAAQARSSDITSTVLSSDRKAISSALPLAALPTDAALKTDVPGFPAKSPVPPLTPIHFPVHCACGGENGASGGKQFLTPLGSSTNFPAPLAGVLRSALAQLPVTASKDASNTPD